MEKYILRGLDDVDVLNEEEKMKCVQLLLTVGGD